MAVQTGGIFNPKWAYDLVKATKKYDEMRPEYQDYVASGEARKSSMEVEAVSGMQKAIDKFNSGNPLGGTIRGVTALLNSKLVPGSPEFVRWQFEDFIPTLKFNRWVNDVKIRERQLGRTLTRGEKIAITRRIQQFYGEMNEKLYGRSGTVSSAMRLGFMFPGYGEGNFRTTFSSLNLKDVLSGKGEARTNLKYVANSLIATTTLATIGTAIMTGKFPDVPKKLEDIRDLFKIKTGQKDGNGENIYIDLMTYDKDFWAVYGNLATLKPQKIPTDLGTRVGNAVSPFAKILTDMSLLTTGQMIYDYKNTPVWYSTDNFTTKWKKFLIHEGGELAPITAGTFGQSQQKGSNILESTGTAVVGLRPTTSERVKQVKQVRNDIYTLLDSKREKQIELNKLVKENPKEAKKEMDEFNQDIKDKLVSMSKTLGRNIDASRFMIKKFNAKEALPVEEQVNKLISGSNRP
jgi:hypothetical protein